MRNGACARGVGFAFEFVNRAAARFILRFRSAEATGAASFGLASHLDDALLPFNPFVYCANPYTPGRINHLQEPNGPSRCDRNWLRHK